MAGGVVTGILPHAHPPTHAHLSTDLVMEFQC